MLNIVLILGAANILDKILENGEITNKEEKEKLIFGKYKEMESVLFKA
jgi:hypothetical protein